MVVTALIIGGGNRGSNYAAYSKDRPNDFKVVAIAEPRDHVRARIAKRYGIPDTHAFTDWRQALAEEKFADCVVVSTPDRLHKEPAIAAAKKGYHVLLEKPMAPTQADCEAIYQTCAEAGVMMAVCHVLRYKEQAVTARRLIDSGAIGDLVNIQLIEPVGYYHFAHSYVRGNWRNEGQSASSLLAKSCHDLDLIQYWMGDTKCTRVSSFGHLTHFKPENKPEGAGSRCLSCPVEQSCAYSAKKVYLDLANKQHWGWPVSVVTEGGRDIEDLVGRLEHGPYGRCVYGCDNDVMTNQVVNMQFEGGQTASFTMVAFTQKLCERSAKIQGTKGELEIVLDHNTPVKLYDFLTKRSSQHKAEGPEGGQGQYMGGHAGADFLLMNSFVRAIQEKNPSLILTGPLESLTSHLLVFAAERARVEDRVVRLGPVGPAGSQAALT